MNRSLVAAVAACTLLVGPGIASADQLIEAAESGDVELVRQLIDSGADLNKQGRVRGGAASGVGEAPCRRRRAARGARRRRQRREPAARHTLHVAAATGNEAMVLLLLERGASLNVARSSDGYTPLHVAAEAGRTQVVRLLLDRGADVNSLSHGRSGLRRCTWRSCAAAPRWQNAGGGRRDGAAGRADRDPQWLRRAPSEGKWSRAIARPVTRSTRRPRPHGRANAVGSIWPRAGVVARFPSTPLRCNGSAGCGRGGAQRVRRPSDGHGSRHQHAVRGARER